MDTNALFTMALGLVSPWRVTSLAFDAAAKRLDMFVDSAPGSAFPCPGCAVACGVYDWSPQSWRHVNFFENLTFIEARQPRTKYEKHGVKTVTVAWSRPASGFTLPFEALTVDLARNGMTSTGRMLGEHDARIWRVLEHYVDEARGRATFAGVEKSGADETARAKGHVYVRLFAGIVEAREIFVAEGKDHETVSQFKRDFAAHGGDPAKVSAFSLDMSAAFIKGIRQEFKAAEMTFDKFHVIKLANDAVDRVRRGEQRTEPGLKKTRYVWLKNKKNLEPGERALFDGLRNSTLKTACAYRIRRTLQALYDQEPDGAKDVLRLWCFWATHSRLPAMIRLAKTLKQHQAGLLRWFDSRINNGLLEGINSLAQAAKARARGFRSTRKITAIIHLLLSKLDVQLPNVLPSAIHAK